MKRREIIPNAEPFYLPGNKIGCLLIHGFTGAPTEMRPLGDYLNGLGYTVLGVRLTGHGTNIDAMIRSRWQDWSASVEDGWHLLASHTEQIFIIGLSMGGVLTFQTAPKFSPQGIVTMSTPAYTPNKYVHNYPLLVKLASRFYPKMKKDEGGWANPEVALDHISYSANPLRSAVELNTLIAEMRSSIPEINVPTLVIHSKNDTYIPPNHAEILFDLLKEKDKELFWVEDSDHVITRDGNPLIVFEKIAEFIKVKQK